MSNSPVSLIKLSGDAVMRHRNSYPYVEPLNKLDSIKKKNLFELLTDEDIQTLLEDNELSAQRVNG
jgi:hypothetical protein